MSPAEQVAFMEAALAEAGVTVREVSWSKQFGVAVAGWQPTDHNDVMIGKAFELLARAQGKDPVCCARCWAADAAETCTHLRRAL